MQDTTLRIIIKFTVPEGKIGDVKSLLETIIERSRSEKGLLRYEWFLSGDGKDLYVHEWYADAGAVGEHLKLGGEPLAKFLELVPMDRIEVYGNLPEELAEQLPPVETFAVGYWNGFAK